MKPAQKTAGFSMLELAIVIVIIGLITGMGIYATLGVVDSAKYRTTEQKLDEIERALVAFRNKNNRLPCPATVTLTASSSNYGLESAPLGDCTTGSPAATMYDSIAAEGAVPTRTLGLPDSFMHDAWGRKFAYSVDKNATFWNAFDVIHPKEFCGITVRDGNNIAITGNATYTYGAIYALFSFGPDGHGGYAEAGVRQSADSTDVHQNTNCHCNASAVADATYAHAIYVQKEATTTFDDIVRYKERWQLVNAHDTALFTGTYAGPDVIMSTKQNGLSNFRPYERQCGNFRTYSGTKPANINSTSFEYGLEFTTNNSHILLYINANCYLYPIGKDGTIGAAAAGTDLTCTAVITNPANQAAMSENGYLAMSTGAAPHVNLWKFDNGYFKAFSATSPAATFSPALSNRPSKIAFSNMGKYIALSRNRATTYTQVYAQTGGRLYTKLADPTSLPSIAIDIAFSKDERLLAMAENGSTNVRIWSINHATNATALVTTLNGTFNTINLAFSPDGQYFVMTGGTATSGNAYTTAINIYKIDGNTFTAINPTGNFTATYSGAFADVSFSRDSNFIFIALTTGNGDNRALVFRRTSPTTFKEVDVINEAWLAGEYPISVRVPY